MYNPVHKSNKMKSKKVNNPKRSLYVTSVILIVTVAVGYLSGCTSANASQSSSDSNRTVNQQTKDYWYDGTAEITSYKLEQARYGDIHEGTAVLLYVTEPFSKESNTKADNHRDSNVPVLKLNSSKKFVTGIYPYSIMTSSFFPFENGDASLKIASSMQEWCGMTYMQMTNKGDLNFKVDSYFEGQSFENKKIEKQLLEDDLWTLIRLNPKNLPTGEQEIIPALSYMRYKHVALQAYKAIVSLDKTDETTNKYTIAYPELSRSISIQFSESFPHAILGWEEEHYSGYGADKKLLTTKATLNKSVKTDYWNKNLNQHSEWRDKLGL